MHDWNTKILEQICMECGDTVGQDHCKKPSCDAGLTMVLTNNHESPVMFRVLNHDWGSHYLLKPNSTLLGRMITHLYEYYPHFRENFFEIEKRVLDAQHKLDMEAAYWSAIDKLVLETPSARRYEVLLQELGKTFSLSEDELKVQADLVLFSLKKDLEERNLA